MPVVGNGDFLYCVEAGAAKHEVDAVQQRVFQHAMLVWHICVFEGLGYIVTAGEERIVKITEKWISMLVHFNLVAKNAGVAFSEFL